MHENFGEDRTAVLAGPGKRDLRLDLLRGIGQWMVFLDHIPYNFLNWFTSRNYGFSDAAEIFVFISGYSIDTPDLKEAKALLEELGIGVTQR